MRRISRKLSGSTTFTLISLLLALTALVLLPASQLRAAEPIRIGFVGGLSGACGANVEGELKGVQLALEEVNAAGGIIGRKVELIVRDSKTKPDEGAKQARDLVVTQKVDVLTGVCSSAVLLAVSAVAKEYKIPVYSTIANTQRASIDFGHPYYFQVLPNTLMEATAGAEFVAKQPWKRIVTIGYDYEWGHTSVESFTAHLKEIKPEAQVVKNLWPPLGPSNMSSYITAALEEKPDVIVAYVFGGGLTSLIKQGAAYGLLERTQLFTFMTVPELKALGKEMPDNVWIFNRGPFYAMDNPAGQAFIAKFRAKYNDWPDDWALLGYDGFQVMRQAVEKAGTVEAEKFMATVKSMTYDSVRGIKLKIRALDGNANAPTYIGQTKQTGEYPFAAMVNIMQIPGERTLPSEQEVLARRAAAQKQ